MRLDTSRILIAIVSFLLSIVSAPVLAQEPPAPEAAHPEHEKMTERQEEMEHKDTGEEHEENEEEEAEAKVEGPALPEGMTLDEVLDRAEQTPPDDYPDAVADFKLYAFLLVEQLEYRLDVADSPDHIGWELQGWFGGDFNKLVWKQEGEGIYESPGALESETDLLYARLITPFWNLQFGAQYANEWTTSTGDYEDRWSAAVALQGMAPGQFEVDLSIYLSQHANLTLELELEYDIRITQRLVLQPLAALGFSAQDIPERAMGIGMTDANVDLRLRYEIKREFAPYIGGRWQTLVGPTANIARDADEAVSRWFLIGGIRFAFL